MVLAARGRSATYVTLPRFHAVQLLQAEKVRLLQQEDNGSLSDVREPRMSGARLVTSAEAVEAVRVGDLDVASAP